MQRRPVNRNTEAHRSGNMKVKSQLALDEAVARALQHTENKLAAVHSAAGNGGRSSNPTYGNGASTNTSHVGLQALREAVGVETLRNGHTECVICSKGYKSKEKLIILPCQHDYHSHCIKKWLKINKTCPVCRTKVFG